MHAHHIVLSSVTAYIEKLPVAPRGINTGFLCEEAGIVFGPGNGRKPLVGLILYCKQVAWQNQRSLFSNKAEIRLRPKFVFDAKHTSATPCDDRRDRSSEDAG